MAAGKRCLVSDGNLVFVLIDRRRREELSRTAEKRAEDDAERDQKGDEVGHAEMLN